MIVSKDTALLQHARHLTTQAKSDPLNFKHDEVGYNYRLTNMQAALGLAQMEQLEGFITTNCWFYSLYLEDGFPLTRDELIAAFAARNIQARPIWGLICDQLPYLGFEQYQIETARRYEKRVVNVPCSTNLTTEDVETVVAALINSTVTGGNPA